MFCEQRTNWVSPLHKVKKDYFTNLNEKHITENKYFWKAVKPFLLNKVLVK